MKIAKSLINAQSVCNHLFCIMEVVFVEKVLKKITELANVKQDLLRKMKHVFVQKEKLRATELVLVVTSCIVNSARKTTNAANVWIPLCFTTTLVFVKILSKLLTKNANVLKEKLKVMELALVAIFNTVTFAKKTINVVNVVKLSIL